MIAREKRGKVVAHMTLDSLISLKITASTEAVIAFRQTRR